MQVASVKDRRPISFGIQDLGLVNSSDAPPCFSALCASSGGCATPLMEHCMEQNTNSNIANDALLEILLEHPDFSDFERKGGAECFPKKNVAQICADYTSNTNQGLRYSLHRLQEPAPNCRSLLRDGGQPRILKTPLTAEELAPIGLLSELVQRIRKRVWEVA